MVTVTLALTAAPATCPVLASTPLGTSTATTGPGAAFAASARRAYGSRSAPEAPIPTSPSMIRPARPSSCASTTRPPASSSARSPASCVLDPASTAPTHAPRLASRSPA